MKSTLAVFSPERMSEYLKEYYDATITTPKNNPESRIALLPQYDLELTLTKRNENDEKDSLLHTWIVHTPEQERITSTYRVHRDIGGNSSDGKKESPKPSVLPTVCPSTVA